jgi:hypothetical protein
MGSVKHLVSPEHDNHLVAADVGNVMRPTRHGLDHLRLLSGRNQFMRLAGLHMPELEARLSPNDQKLLGLAVMIMTAPRDAGVGGEVRELTAIGRLEHFCKYAARVTVLRHVLCKRLHWQVTHVGGIQRAR